MAYMTRARGRCAERMSGDEGAVPRPAAHPAARTGVGGLLPSAAFGWLLLGSFVGSLGTGMSAFALGVHVYRLSGSAAAVSMVQLCAFAPLVLLAPLAGVLADRFDRRALMVLGDGGSVIGLLLAGAAATWTRSVALVCLGVLLSSLLAALTEPALRATVTEVVDAEDYVRASGMLQLAAAAKYLLAPVVAGLAVGVIGVGGVVMIDAATCLVTAALSWRVRGLIGPVPADADPAGLGPRLVEGWRAVMGGSRVRTVVCLMVVATFAMGTVQTLLKPILLPLGSVGAVGTVETLAAVGMVLGAGAVSALTGTAPARLLVLGLGGAGVAMMLLCLRASPAWIAATGMVLFASLPAGNAGADALVRAEVPQAVQARAWGIISVVTQSGYLLAYAVMGVAADLLLEPALADGGAWAQGLGAVVGTGPGRGSAVLVSLLGLAVVVLALVAHRLRRRLDPPGGAGFTGREEGGLG